MLWEQSLFKSYTLNLSRGERLFLEIAMIKGIYDELFDLFKSRYLEYQQLVRIKLSGEDKMTNIKVIQEIIKDILFTKEYSLAGIATYIRMPEDVLEDIVAGMNNNPTFELSLKIFELHMQVRKDLYSEIFQKVIQKSNILYPHFCNKNEDNTRVAISA